jgi:uncharacterized protein
MLTFEWDDAKSESNLAKHGIAFDEAGRIFDDPGYVLLLDRVVEGEVRWHAIGFVRGTLITVVHNHPDPENHDRIRIISARHATGAERRLNDEENA